MLIIPSESRGGSSSLVHRTEKSYQPVHPYRGAKIESTPPLEPPPKRTAKVKAKSSLASPPLAQTSSRPSKHVAEEPPSSMSDETPIDSMEWDGWPDGDFSALFSIGFVEEHDNLQVHWATRPLGGRGGSSDAEVWQDGKLTRRQCQGVIECENTNCQVVTRPQTRPSGLVKQLSAPCSCGSQLVHYSCSVRSTLHTFVGGVYYYNGGTHNHSRPTVRLHMSKKEKGKFAEIVEEHPTTGPLKLLVGRPGAAGPAKSVAHISPVLVNADRVKYERRQVLKGSGGYGGDNFLKEFAKFEEDNPDFIRTSQFGQIAVIVMQTPFMASLLVKSAIIESEAVNGLVSDAAHGFWLDRNTLLIVSSVYEPLHLKCWVPAAISYSNGGTAEHYRIHFFELFLSIGQECDERGINMTDDMFANVVDFSLAERNGFILAFVDFWRRRVPDERTVNELLEAAPKLLKGCVQHFRSQIARVKKISGVVDPAQTDVFASAAKKLLTCQTIEEFTTQANQFIEAFPRAETWIRWWMLPAHACMLFPSFRVMDVALWEKIPETTNAEEAMHWKMYAGLGKSFGLLPGLKALVAFAEYYRTQFDAKKRRFISCGVKVHYGLDRQHWKVTASLHGRTKYNRTPGAGPSTVKNDGRPPDTAKALIGRRKHKAMEYEKGYVWRNNSCWLDASLIAIFSAASRDYSMSMEPMFAGLPIGHPLLDLRQLIHTRLHLPLAGYEEGGCTILSDQRDGFRKILRTTPRTLITSLTGFGHLFVCLEKSIFTPEAERAASYFRMFTLELKSCDGSGEQQEHFALGKIKLRNECQLSPAVYQQYQGNLRAWFADLMRPSKPQALGGCWRVYEGDTFCLGNTVCHEVVLNIPNILIIEMGEPPSDGHWDIPSALYPYPSNSVATAHGVKYSIAAHAYVSTKERHFITRYLSSDGTKNRIFDYDGREHEGHAILQSSSALKTLLTGSTHLLRDIPATYQLDAIIYHLDGGEPAQQYFRKQQIMLAKKLGLQLT
ncbi:hypothetical protein B0H16DRAFT_1336930, partial [Mycena metata]